jgi:hypothetical protein
MIANSFDQEICGAMLALVLSELQSDGDRERNGI